MVIIKGAIIRYVLCTAEYSHIQLMVADGLDKCHNDGLIISNPLAQNVPYVAKAKLGHAIALSLYTL